MTDSSSSGATERCRVTGPSWPGFRSAADNGGFGCNRIDELELAPFAEVVAAELSILFDKQAKLGIVCSSRELADPTWSAARQSGRRVGESLWLHSNQAGNALGPPPFPYLAPSKGDEAQGAQLGRLLASRLSDPKCAPVHRRVPCELIDRELTP